MLTPRLARGLLPCLLLLVLGATLPAQGKAPKAGDSEKQLKKLDRAVADRDWDEAADLCAEGLALTARGSAWDEAHGEDLGVEQRLAWEGAVRETFGATIEYGNRKRARDIQEAALAMVTAYLEYWPEHTNSYEMLFQKAEVAWTVREYRLAAESYQAVYENNPNSGRRRVEAAAGWAGALWIDGGDDWEFFDGQAAQVRVQRLDHTDEIARHQPIELRAEELELIAALDAFVTSNHEHARAPDVLYRTIVTHYTRYQGSDGVPRCIAFLQGFDDHARAPWVARMLVDLAAWSEREGEVQLRVKAMGLRWEDLEAAATTVSGDLPAPLEPTRLELFPREY